MCEIACINRGPDSEGYLLDDGIRGLGMPPSGQSSNLLTGEQNQLSNEDQQRRGDS